jgi:hypothetical protein
MITSLGFRLPCLTLQADFLATEPRNLLRRPQLLQPLNNGLQYIVRVSRALALRKNVSNPGRLDHSTHGGACDNACAFACWSKKDATRSEVPERLMGDCVPHQRNGEKVLLCVLTTLPDGFWNLIGLSKTNANMSISIADYDQSREAKPPTALDDLRHAIDAHDSVVEVEIVWIDRSIAHD